MAGNGNGWVRPGRARWPVVRPRRSGDGRDGMDWNEGGGMDAADDTAMAVLEPQASETLAEYPETDDEMVIRAAIAEEGSVPVDEGAQVLEGRIVATGTGSPTTAWVDPAPPLKVLPTWASREQFPHAARWLVRYVRAWIAFHAVRVPTKYTWRVLARTPRGTWRIIVATWRWVFDHESLDLRRTTGAGTSPREVMLYLAVSRQRNERVKLRGSIIAVTAAALAIAVLVGHAVAPAGAQVLALALVLLAVARVGTNPDAPLTDRVMVTPRARKLTADVIDRAFRAAGLSSEKEPIAFPAPIQRDGPGWRAVVDLPYSTTAEQACKRRDRVAAGLDLDEVQVWLDRVRGTAGSARRVALWVADEDPYEKPSGTWPLVAADGPGTVDLFKPFPFGQDQRGREIMMALMFTSVIVGSMPRMGKTYAARLLVLAAALDVLAELHVWDGKGGKDWRMFTPIAHRAGFGVRDEVVADLLDDLTGIHTEMGRRYEVFATLDSDRCPESKITPELAGDRRLGLHYIVISIDEFQRYITHPKYGEKIVEILIDLAKVGPAAGIILILATQKPDAKSLPSDLRDVIGTRYALKCMTYQASDTVLGAGSYSAGYDASRFLRSHKGVGWLLGADDSGAVEEAVTVRTYLAEVAHAEKVITRARALREKAGRLTGQAAGIEPERAITAPDTILHDVAAVLAGPDGPKAWSEVILDRLATRDSRYVDLTRDELTARLRKAGVKTGDVWGTDSETGKGTTRRGYTLDDLQTAITQRDKTEGRKRAG